MHAAVLRSLYHMYDHLRRAKNGKCTLGSKKVSQDPATSRNLLQPSLAPAQAMVLRDGVPRRIPSSEVVIDDVVLLHEGDRVPADGILIQPSVSLMVDESLLTGEATPVPKHPPPANLSSSSSASHLEYLPPSGSPAPLYPHLSGYMPGSPAASPSPPPLYALPSPTPAHPAKTPPPAIYPSLEPLLNSNTDKVGTVGLSAVALLNIDAPSVTAGPAATGAGGSAPRLGVLKRANSGSPASEQERAWANSCAAALAEAHANDTDHTRMLFSVRQIA